MKINNIIKGLAFCASAAAMLTACDDEKIYTTDYEEDVLPQDIKLYVSEILPVGVGMDTTLTYEVLPVDFPDKTVGFFSSNEAVATVSADGTVHGVKEGTAIITCTLPVGFGPNSQVTINVIPEVIKAESLTIKNASDSSEDGAIFETDEVQLQGEILPANHTYSRLVWKSLDESIATIDDNGLVKCLKAGTAKIVAVTTDRSGVKAEYDFEIKKFIAAEKVEIAALSEALCLVGGPKALNVTYTPANATIGSVTWESSDENVVTVHRGVVSPTGFGSATVTATCAETGEKASVTVEVKAGWYVWNADNAFTGISNGTSWVCANATQADSKVEDGKWRVYFPDAGTGKWRRDIKINCSASAMFPMHSSLPVLAMRTTIPRGGNNTWDVRDSGNPKCNDGVDLPDGTRLIYIDLTAKFEGWGSGIHEFNLFQLKVADVPNGNVDPNAPYYDIYWIRTFASLDEATQFAIQDATDNPIK